MKKLAWVVAFTSLVYSLTVRAAEVIRIPTFTTEHPIVNYLALQLEQAVRVTNDDFGAAEIVRLKIPVEEERQLRNLNQGITDVAWATCSVQRNSDYRMVPVPMIAGLFGFRVNLIRETDHRFNQINTLNDLTSLIAVQSPKWHDYDILVKNGFTVLSSDRFSAYRAVEKGLADFYPRGIAEVIGEMEIANTKGLVIAPGHALRYPLIFLLYVEKHNQKLANRLTLGFQRNIENGEFLALLEQQDWYTTAVSLLPGRKVFELTNHGSLGGCKEAEETYKDLLQAPYVKP
ncbi:hypothetical protein [Alteromonas lipolytica]|uniref:Solute-binding protein family 3/N-terminal domain-containing protein n=1 Tax=Alteromonas lipolytica TaxID=1856405 RepID=A0A1E8FKJ5_9ALTE|nr:hypothetical protein [Alteromonas lipolytica]OFI36276.1 hypothetical protein BFC17_09155 [Alteromonas lipolytica]GGF79334.1 hypothetical protein GCM10011338_34620 [Alteromonas lipolytica]